MICSAELSRNNQAQVDLAAMLRTLGEMYSQSHQGLEFAFKIERPSILVPGMELRLGQVLCNIIDNAISFSPPQGKIHIDLRCKNGLAHVSVQDEGPGIPAENVEDVFKRFYSERPSAEDFGQHSGLGLAISKQIVEAHGGTLRAENVEPHGARFIMTLALA
jgi:two-component system, OmpR family, sensor histidine kinase ChvG